jgi:hypothetical protein
MGGGLGGPPSGDREAPRRRDQKGGKKRNEGGPKGPIRERQTGRVYDVSQDPDDDLDLDEGDMTGVDDFATSAPRDEADDDEDT